MRRRRVGGPAGLLGLAILSAACGSSSVSTAAPAPTSAPTSTGAPTPAPTAAVAPGDWPVYHGDAVHRGRASVGPRPGPLHAAWRAPAPDGDVDAAPVAGAGVVVLATEHDVVEGVDARTGSLRWTRKLGDPVPGAALPCGNIDPSGVTSTPVIDVGANLVYVVAFEQPAHHELVALDLASGAERGRVGVDPAGADPKVEQQRGALTLANGRIYIPFGGLYGDCGNYNGFVVGVPVNRVGGAGSTPVDVYQVPTGREGGIWSSGGVAVGDDGSVFAATGNAGSSGAFDGGDAVVRLTPDLKQVDVFAPANWQSLAARDSDLGSTSPALLAGGRIVQIGKSGTAYLLAANALGGVGGELASVQVGGATFGATAQDGDMVYLPGPGGVIAVTVGVRTLSVRWRGARMSPGPPVVVGGGVWALDLGAGDLVALGQGDGREVARLHVGAVAHFATPGLAGGLLVVATLRGGIVAVGGA